MPELPEVETIARALREPLVGRTITGVRNEWPRHIGRPTLAELRRRIEGKQILGITRRGKYLVFALSQGEFLLIHLKMSGQLLVESPETPADSHVHTVFALAKGCELRFRDVRKFGRVYLVRDPQEVLRHLGPEPLSPRFTADLLRSLLQRRKRVLKPLLLDQMFIAGIGNIYADEALHLAGLSPVRRSDSLTATECAQLYDGIVKALRTGIAREGASIDNYRKPDGSQGNMQQAFLVYGRAGEPCLRCGNVIARVVLGGRGTHYCPSCQV